MRRKLPVSVRTVFVHLTAVEGGSEIFFIAEHDVNEGSEFPVHFQGAFFSADGLPKRIAIVEIVGNDNTVFARGLHGFVGDKGGGLRKGGENAARMNPARALPAENFIPIDLAGLQLGYGRGDRQPTAAHQASLGEVQPVTGNAAHSIRTNPPQEQGRRRPASQ